MSADFLKRAKISQPKLAVPCVKTVILTAKKPQSVFSSEAGHHRMYRNSLPEMSTYQKYEYFYTTQIKA